MTIHASERSWIVALRSKDADTLEVVVYDDIGKSFWGDGITAKDFMVQLRAAPAAKKISLRVNSYGGIVDDAKAMVNLLGERAANGVAIEATVDGIAASSAAYLLTAATRVVMPANAFMMIHQVRGSMRGTADDLAAGADIMRRTNEQLAEAFSVASARRGKQKSKEDYLAAFSAGDLYLDADQAIEWGLADEKREGLKVAAHLADLSGLELGSAPEALRSAPYVLLEGQALQVNARGEITGRTAPIKIPPAPSARETQTTGQQETKPMKMIAFATIAALLGMSAEAAEAAEEKDVLDGLKKKLASEPTSVAVSGVKLLGVATEADATSKLQGLQRTELAVLGITEKATSEEALLAIQTWKTKADQTDALTTQVGQLTEKHRIAARDASIEKCGREGTLPPARHEWARQQFATAEQVETFCTGMPKGFFNSVTEITNQDAAVALTDEEKRVCKLTGVSEKTYLEQKKLERTRASAQVGA